MLPQAMTARLGLGGAYVISHLFNRGIAQEVEEVGTVANISMYVPVVPRDWKPVIGFGRGLVLSDCMQTLTPASSRTRSDRERKKTEE